MPTPDRLIPKTRIPGIRLPEFPSGENLMRQTLKIASQVILDIYPLLKKDYAEEIEKSLSIISPDEALLKKLSLPNQREKAVSALNLGNEVMHKILKVIPDLVDLNENKDKSVWKELMRKNLSLKDSEIINSPNVKIVACGAELFAILPEKSFDDSPSIGTRFNKGIVQILMEPFLPLFSARMTNNLIYPRVKQTDETIEARRILRRLDNEGLATDRNQLIEAYIASLIPVYILSGTKISLLNYPK